MRWWGGRGVGMWSWALRFVGWARGVGLLVRHMLHGYFITMCGF